MRGPLATLALIFALGYVLAAVPLTHGQPPRVPPESPGDTQDGWATTNPIESSEVAQLNAENVRLRRRLTEQGRRFRHTLNVVIHAPAYGQTWLERAFLCIHAGEGGWGAATGNGFYGGVQMDYGFMRSYGGDYLRAFGTANNWPVSVQLAVAIRAYENGRGFRPWPNTARACGLL